VTTKRFAPMLATTPKHVTAEQLLGDDAWAMDVKADGDRCAVVVDEGTVTTFGRNAQRLTRPLPHAVRKQLTTCLDSGRYILDGEVVGDMLYLFDLVTVGDKLAGELLGPWHPWDVRRATLDTLLATWPSDGPIRGVPYAIGAKAKLALVEKVVTGRGEGVLAKRIDSLYREGARSRDWVKVKRHHEIDCVVMWLGTEKRNMGVGCYEDGKLIEVAEVGRLTADGARCEVGSVVAVRCLYSTEANRLVQPTLPRLRTDKAATECDLAQLDTARTNPLLLAELTGDTT
jgi:bifunctional non-homologous end joining protein LigD